jgi:hypothetical protein
MKVVRPVGGRLGLRSSTARRGKPLRKRNATTQAAEGNLGGFCVGPYWTNLPSRAYREGANVNSTLKVQNSETTLIQQIKAEIKKRSEAKAKRMMLKRPKRLDKRSG